MVGLGKAWAVSQRQGQQAFAGGNTVADWIGVAVLGQVGHGMERRGVAWAFWQQLEH